LPSPKLSDLAHKAVHDSAIIVDTHWDTPQRFLYENFDMLRVFREVEKASREIPAKDQQTSSSQ
jgi:hypothetical protein